MNRADGTRTGRAGTAPLENSAGEDSLSHRLLQPGDGRHYGLGGRVWLRPLLVSRPAAKSISNRLTPMSSAHAHRRQKSAVVTSRFLWSANAQHSNEHPLLPPKRPCCK
ncbi:hypothetical protein CN233_14295 [Sinorhizobium meliloti]|uniref:Uncharacterized protein n=1 Tax=Rhizobium meliloti (strain 1021) TaxID=266834 RepID=Q92XY7_RHIME|nr:Hypothetical protein SMa2011 [Sinorhizobium meliloti 1021]AGG70797.1 Hypothetical protein SM2011_a2011 [Sinorhizobium meliloti 2011]ASP61084.1 hypothetical protein CDO30_22990 [Sinorhizobium meliloti]MQW43860.1 hypothetical protein [Sinorhizobium meliloti]MQW47530.1 hypothetical protein [Sinorhizobium meliloti]